jgi:hypothetical protein
MGMYTTIGGKELKYGDLLSRACKDMGIVPYHGTVVLSRQQVSDIVLSMALYFEKGRKLVDGSTISGQSIYTMVSDAEMLSALFDWLVFCPEDDHISFG